MRAADDSEHEDAQITRSSDESGGTAVVDVQPVQVPAHQPDEPDNHDDQDDENTKPQHEAPPVSVTGDCSAYRNNGMTHPPGPFTGRAPGPRCHQPDAASALNPGSRRMQVHADRGFALNADSHRMPHEGASPMRWRWTPPAWDRRNASPARCRG